MWKQICTSPIFSNQWRVFYPHLPWHLIQHNHNSAMFFSFSPKSNQNKRIKISFTIKVLIPSPPKYQLKPRITKILQFQQIHTESTNTRVKCVSTKPLSIEIHVWQNPNFRFNRNISMSLTIRSASIVFSCGRWLVRDRDGGRMENIMKFFLLFVKHHRRGEAEKKVRRVGVWWRGKTVKEQQLI